MSNFSWRIVIIGSVVILMAGVALSAPASPQKIETLKIGAKAPNFNLIGVDGKKHKLSDFNKSDILVIVFTCNHCPTAQAYEERIKQLAADYKSKGVALVAVSPNDPQAVRLDELGYSDLSDSLEEMKIRAKDKKFNFPFLYDGDKQNVSQSYGPVSTPHVFIFDKQRILRYVGRVDDSEKLDRVKSHDTRNAIEALLAGKEVSVQTTPTFGCSIKWSDKRGSVKKAFEAWAKEAVTIEPVDPNGVKEIVKNSSDKLRLINVWASWCAPCAIEFEDLVNINRMYRNRNFEMITINVDDSKTRGDVLPFLKKQQASCKNYQSTSEDKDLFADALDRSWRGGIPYTILVKPGGEIIYRHVTPIEPLEVKKAIVEYLGRTYK